MADELIELPSELGETARRLAGGELRAAAPRDAATVVLLREGPDGPLAYLLRRVRSMAFAAGMVVFPGGSVDPRDADLPDDAWTGPPPSSFARRLGSDEALARSLVCAAVRETFEESGVMLAGPDADEAVSDTSRADWEADRLALLDRSVSLAELLVRRSLVLRADLLRVWAHWITPEVEPRRFDTRFFVAAMPAGQRTRHVGGEADLVAWARPADAMAAHDRGEIAMLPPTSVTLGELSAYPDVAAVIAAADGREIPVVMPRVVLDAAGTARLEVGGTDGGS